MTQQWLCAFWSRPMTTIPPLPAGWTVELPPSTVGDWADADKGVFSRVILIGPASSKAAARSIVANAWEVAEWRETMPVMDLIDMQDVFPAFGVKVFYPTPPLDTTPPVQDPAEDTGGAK